MGRTQSREQAFLLIFEKLFNPEYSLEDMLALTAESALFEPDEFTKELYLLTQTHMAEADEKVALYLKNWRLERLPKVSVAILRLAVSEILFADEIPDSVTVNEAVNLAKKYAAAEDAAFINGVLGALIRDMQA